MLRRLLAWLDRPSMPLRVALLSTLLCLPALGAGLVMDDWYHRAVLTQDPGVAYVGAPWRGLFCFLPGPGLNGPLQELGILPWWADPDVRACFLRPLAVLSHQLDYALWPDAPALQHAHSLAWWALAAALVAGLYRRVLPGLPLAAALAALLFALDDDHAMVIGWIAGRNGLLALVAGVATIHLHLAGRPLGALLATVLGLGVGEPFLGALAYVAAWEATAQGPRRARLLRLVPYGLLVGAWRLYYQEGGYGAAGSGLYVDPGREPLRFLWALAERGPWMAAGQALFLPVDLWIFLGRGAQVAVAGVSVGLLLGLFLLLAPLLRGSRPARFLLLGGLLALVPPAGAFPTARLMMWAGIGFFGLLALAAQQVGLLGGEPVPGLRRRVVAALVGGNLLLGLVALPGRMLLWPASASAFHAGALHAPADPALAGQTLVFVNGAELMVGYTGLIRSVAARTAAPGPSLPAPRRVTLLSSMAVGSTVERVDARTLAIQADGGFLGHTMDRMFRGEGATFQVGQVLTTPDLEVTVQALTPDGRPAAVHVRFAAPLVGGAYRFVAVVDGELVEWSPPPVGGSLRLEASLPRLSLRPLGPTLR